MSDVFDKQHFEQLMGTAVELHNQHQYEDALALSTEAYGIAPDGSFEKGRAARDNGARSDRLGRVDEAYDWGDKAVEAHSQLLLGQDPPTREALRESSASYMYLGTFVLREYLKTGKFKREVGWETCLELMRSAWTNIQEAKAQAPAGINQRVDQYEINQARRVSMTETLIGDPKRGRSIGVKAVALAFMSESPRLDTSTPNLSFTERMRAKGKALVGGLAALAVNVIDTNKYNRVRRVFLAQDIAERML